MIFICSIGQACCILYGGTINVFRGILDRTWNVSQLFLSFLKWSEPKLSLKEPVDRFRDRWFEYIFCFLNDEEDLDSSKKYLGKVFFF